MDVIRALLAAILIGLSIASALLVFILLSLLGRFAKDLAEVIATWQYITAFTVIAAVSLRAALRVKSN